LFENQFYWSQRELQSIDDTQKKKKREREKNDKHALTNNDKHHFQMTLMESSDCNDVDVDDDEKISFEK